MVKLCDDHVTAVTGTDASHTLSPPPKHTADSTGSLSPEKSLQVIVLLLLHIDL